MSLSVESLNVIESLNVGISEVKVKFNLLYFFLDSISGTVVHLPLC